MARTKGAKDRSPRKPRGSDGPRVLNTDGPPSTGHNSGELTEEQRQALFLQNLTKIETLKAEIETLKAELASVNSKLRNAYKVAKSDGFKKKDFDYAAELRNNDDKEMIERRRREQQIAKWLAHPIGTQPDMFEEPDRRPIEDKAYEEGKIAGMEGKGCSPPYDAVPGQKWVEGWHDGLTANRSLFQKKEEPQSPAPTQPEAFDDALPGEGEEAAEATQH